MYLWGDNDFISLHKMNIKSIYTTARLCFTLKPLRPGGIRTPIIHCATQPGQVLIANIKVPERF
jgi:hypothetical protein